MELPNPVEHILKVRLPISAQLGPTGLTRIYTPEPVAFMGFEFAVSHDELKGVVAFPHGTDISTHLFAAAEKPRFHVIAFLHDV